MEGNRESKEKMEGKGAGVSMDVEKWTGKRWKGEINGRADGEGHG